MWTRVGVVAGVVAAVAAVAALGVARSSSSAKSNSGNECSGDRESIVTCYQEAAKPASMLHEDEVIADAARHRDDPPVGQGPWPFVVVRDLDKGLKVRTSNTVDGIQIGALAHLNTAWAFCQAHSGFDPERNGDVWFQIGWNHQQPDSTDYFESEPGATGRGWVHSYYLAPVNHNGAIPPC